MEAFDNTENTTMSVMDLTQHFNSFLDDEYQLATATANFLRLNDSKQTTTGVTKSQDHLNTGSRISRNLHGFVNEKYEGSNTDDYVDLESNRKSKRPSSMAAALSQLYDQYESKLRCQEDENDYDDAWPNSPLLNRSGPMAGPIYHLMSSKVATLRDGLHSDRRQKRHSSDEKPLISYEPEESSYINPSTSDLSRKRSVFYLNESANNLKAHAEVVDACGQNFGSCSITGLEKKSRSQLPRNALLQYFGKTTVRPEETSNIDLTRPILELTEPSSLSGRKKSSFVLLRILDDELVLEGRATPSNENISARRAKEPFATKIRKRLSIEKKKNGKTTNSVLRKRSSPTIGISITEKPEKKSVIDLREAELEVGLYGEINDGFESTINSERKLSPRRSGICMDIFLCMGCKSGSSQYRQTIDDDELAPVAKSTTLSTPIHGNKVIDSFELRRIVYCGTEHAENRGVHLLTWLYHATYSTEHAVECHAAACDDLQHAKSLATSLGESIRKAVSK
uniref:uncharacterized protein LOC120327932 isoform X1 n=1 Tax=Styela clava TaxID=7725 RepID=UPI00193A4067|nr:uncharacterized protein LOC120327932 isoform X1 [Styela clava]